MDAVAPTQHSHAAVVTRPASTDSDLAFLEARPGGLAERVGRSFGHWHPAAVFAAVVVAGWLLAAGLTVGLGLLLTKVLLSIGGLAHADNSVESWLAGHRSSTGDDASVIGSILSGGVGIPIAVGLVCVAFALRRHWRAAAFLLSTILIEVTAYRVTTLLVHRPRPDVKRMEHLPVNASFPSGHTAASLSVYIAIALLLTAVLMKAPFESLWLRTVIWIAAVGIPMFVVFSRLYRGMHHPLDAVGGAVLGAAALLIALFAARVAGVVVKRRKSAGRGGAPVVEGT